MDLMRMKFTRRNKLYFVGLICILLLVTPIQAFGQEKQGEKGFSATSKITLLLNDQPLVFEEPPVVEDGRVFVPARYVVDYFGATMEWVNDKREIVIISALGERLVFGADNPYMIFNDQSYFMGVVPSIEDEKIYLPIRHLAEFLHMDVSWDAENQVASFKQNTVHALSELDTPEELAKRYDTSVELLLERNNLKRATDIKAGETLKVVIPEIMEVKIDPKPYFAAIKKEKEKAEAEAKAKAKAAAKAKEEAAAKAAAQARAEEKQQQDLLLLAKIVQVEAGAESYAGQLAVANVVMNRVKDKQFPNTIKGVVYAPNQFPPAHNGLLDKATPGKKAWQAAEAAMAGENNVKGALYFYNPKVTSGSYWNSLTFIKEIGTHRFVGR
ncbi:cell wall hydrolase [Paenibacillus yanchengensis]|uniref:Cell wall hydrolase n=1 Tax=Paenibacillus yanchengensis TaxID=2035833 RepID=A0ABW4YPS7_9BACL